jgi:hypothetical protein
VQSYIPLIVAGGTPLLLRSQGLTEEVSDVSFTCPASAAVTGATVDVSLSLPVTSKALPALGTSVTEATLIVTDNGVAQVCPNGSFAVAAPANSCGYSGAVAGNLITFSNVSFPNSFTARLADVRVNGTLAGATGSFVPVTETLLIGQNGVAQYAPLAATVGNVLNGLVAPSLLNPNAPLNQITGSLNVQTANTTGSILLCNGNVISGAAVAPGPAAALQPSFTITAYEGFPGAFKMQMDTVDNPAVQANQEQGSYLGPNGQGTASSGTQIVLTFSNVPASATVYVPVTVDAVNVPANTAVITLQTSQVTSTAFPAFAAAPVTTAANYPSGVAALPAAVGGVVTATYVVQTSSAGQLENFNIPAYLNIPASTAAAPLAVQSAITVLESLGPVGTITTLPTTAPLFAASTATAINVQQIVACNTTIIFPFVTNASGFETGIAIANTTTDNLGKISTTAPNGASTANPTNGICTLNFYGGVGTQPTAFPTPTIGVSTTAIPTGGSVYANTLTAMSGATNFTGYAIALCNFIEAHGFAYIVDNFGTPSGTAEGYLGIVVPNGRGETNVGTGE